MLEKELIKLGLSDKESKVYLASLALGPNPVQDIARKAGVNRATTYVMIEALTKRGLMASFERGKKRFFSAEAPDRLLSLIRVQEHSLQEQEREFMQVLPQLRALLASSGERPGVRFYEGSEGVRAIHEEILATPAEELWVAGECKPSANELSTPEHEEYDRRLQEKGLRQCVLYTGNIPSEEFKQHPNWKFRKVDESKFPFAGEVNVLGNKIFAFTYGGKLIGVVIESAELATTLRSLMKLAWDTAAVGNVAQRPALPTPPPATPTM